MLGHRIVFQRRVITKEGGHIKQFYVGKNRQYICFAMDSTVCTSGITVRRHFVVATLSGIYHVDEMLIHKKREKMEWDHYQWI
jgi:hypothetical protein